MLSDETLAREVKKLFPKTEEIGGIDRATINRAFGLKGHGPFRGGTAFNYDATNTTGVFAYTAHTAYCLHCEKKRKIVYYYVGEKNKFPPGGMPKTSDFPGLSSDDQFVSDINTRSQLMKTNEHKNNNIAIYNNVEVNIKNVYR